MIAIIGGKGMLGSDVAAECGARGIETKVYDLPEFDITSETAVEGVVRDCRVVINCAAYTDVEKAQTQSELAYAINAQAVGMLGAIARRHGVWVLHFGTDFVFDGTQERPYRETDATNPLSVYGKSKLAGEQELGKSGCEHCIIRIEWTYGVHGNNFIKKVIEAARLRSELKIVDDQIGAPTATRDIAALVCDLLGMRPGGLYHYAASGYASRYDVARFIVERLKLPVSVIACKTSDYKTAAQRPLNSRFDCSKIAGLTTRTINEWQRGLTQFLEML
jgi:dTDP-4-dehydrorhamnose reductase